MLFRQNASTFENKLSSYKDFLKTKVRKPDRDLSYNFSFDLNFFFIIQYRDCFHRIFDSLKVFFRRGCKVIVRLVT